MPQVVDWLRNRLGRRCPRLQVLEGVNEIDGARLNARLWNQSRHQHRLGCAVDDGIGDASQDGPLGTHGNAVSASGNPSRGTNSVCDMPLL